MKKFTVSTLILFMYISLIFSQPLTQTVRGTLLDADSRLPLVGANVIILVHAQPMGTSTDNNGNFRFEGIPVGRINLQLSYMGYESKNIPNVEVNSGKETVLNLSLTESLISLQEVVVKPDVEEGQALNEMALVSARSVSVEESGRYTGGMNDPSRVVNNFAGVTNTADGSSDIIVRGNSPKYMQWRLDGIEITSPYHFDDQNASFGALTALNNSLLATSDFYTGAFSPEYGNVLSNVFDVKLRNGNNEKFEAAAGIGLLGTDMTLEGPFKKGYGGSFLVNYRYSTVGLIQELGLIEVDGVLSFQDATFKLVLPTQKLGTFSIFGLGGYNGFKVEDQGPGNITVPGSLYQADVGKDYIKEAYLANIGLNHSVKLNGNSYLKTSLSYTANGFSDDVYDQKRIIQVNGKDEYIIDPTSNRFMTFKSDANKKRYAAALSYNNKINAKHTLQIGSKYALSGYDYLQDFYDYQEDMLDNVTDFEEHAGMLSNFVSWKYRINEQITMVSGLHNMNVMLNNKSTLEPRVAVNWGISPSVSVHAGYGKHSTMESIQNYYTRMEDETGNEVMPNKDLDLLKADHYVVGFEKRFSSHLMAKVEVYYQYLYDLPVENSDSSFYATINEGIYYRYVDLVNEGTGKNYGLEVTVERFFDQDFYYLANASLFNSTYTALDGIERNTQYNGNFLINVLFGKEYARLGKKGNKTLAFNAKAFYGGGKKHIPLLRDNNGEVAVDPDNNNYYDYSKAYEKALDNIFNLNFSVSYKINTPKATHELFLDLMNLTNHQARLSEFYDETEPGKVGYVKQMFFFPNFMYRVYF
jgi:hypothetical protein